MIVGLSNRRPFRSYRLWTVALLAILTGCGQTRSTDTTRTATEQLLISDAVDRAVSDINFRVLAGRKIFFDAQYLKVANVDDNQYLTSTLRQHMLASGCILAEKREDAEYIVEARSGTVGTDRHDLLYGVPATNLGTISPVPGMPAAIPEIPFAKRTSQRGVAKLAVFAYDRTSGEPVWQSGVSQFTSNSRNVWVFGIGPFQSGTIYRGTNFAGREIPNPLAADNGKSRHPVWVTKEARFREDAVERLTSNDLGEPTGGGVYQAVAELRPAEVPVHAPSATAPLPTASPAGADPKSSAGDPPHARPNATPPDASVARPQATIVGAEPAGSPPRRNGE